MSLSASALSATPVATPIQIAVSENLDFLDITTADGGEFA